MFSGISIFLALPLPTILIELVPQCSNTDIQQFRSVGAIALAPIQSNENMSLLQFAQREQLVFRFGGGGALRSRRLRQCRSRRFGTFGQPQVLDEQTLAIAAQNYGALDHVLQLSNVARPRMAL